MNMDLTHNTDWQIVDRFARSLGVRDPVIDTYLSMQDKYVSEGHSMYASWPETTFYWDKSATTVAAPEKTAGWGMTMTIDQYKELAKELEWTDIEIKPTEGFLYPWESLGAVYTKGILSGIIPYTKDKRTMTYADLYNYLTERVDFRKGKLDLVRDFCTKEGLGFGPIRRTLEKSGVRCDREALWDAQYIFGNNTRLPQY